MPKGYSLHIGLNTVDDSKYRGKYRALRNAENDARFYMDLAAKNGYSPKELLHKDATSENLMKSLDDYAAQMKHGDTLFVSFSGHGTRVQDLNHDEQDSLDEAMVLYDRLFLDDELRLCWLKFCEGSRVLLINDSCFNGTVSRRLPSTDDLPIEPTSDEPVLRGIDSSQTAIDFEKNLSLYKNIKSVAAALPGHAACSIIHIAACGDNQLADDGSVTMKNGLFTFTIRKAHREGVLQGSYKNSFNSVVKLMPRHQTPNWDTSAGKPDAGFENANFLQL